jgi:tetratricopeptide (TPR) repeat protein
MIGRVKSAARAARLGFLLVAIASGASDYLSIQSDITAGRFSQARSALETRIKASPGDGYAHLLLGIVLSEVKEPDPAEAQFRDAIRLRPQDPAPHTNLGNLLASLGRLADAKNQFEAALALNSRDATSLSNLGAVHMSLKEYEPARKCFEAAGRIAPDDVRTLLGLLQAQLRLGLTAASRETAARLLKLRSADEQAVQIVGALEGESGDYAGAVATFEKGLARFPKSPALQFNLGLAQQKAGDRARAIVTFEALRSQQDTAEVEDVVGGVYEEAGKPLEAVKSFQRSAEMEPNNESYRFDYASELLAHLNFEAARLVAEPAVHDFPQSMRLHVALGVALYGLERFEVAQKMFGDLAHRFPDEDLPILYVELCAESTGGSLGEAKELLTASYQRHPDRFMASYLLGRIALQESDASAALPLLQSSVKLRPDYAPSRLELGLALAQLGRTDEAVAQYQAALKLDPHSTESWYRLTLAYRKLGRTELAAEAEKHFKDAEAVSGKPDLVKTFLYSTTK